MSYPKSRAEEIKDTLFGVAVADPYRWLEDEKSPEVKTWMDEQDRLAREHIAKLPGRDRLAARLKELLYVDSISPPARRGTRYFYTRTHKDREKAIVYCREGRDGAEKVLLDPNTMWPDGTTSLGVWAPSWNGKLVAYAVKPNNSDEAELRLRDVATGADSKVDVILGAKYAYPSWLPDSSGFYYVWIPPIGGAVTIAERPGFAEIRFHKIGSDPKSDTLIHERTGNAQTFLGAHVSRDGHWIFAAVQHGWNATDYYFKDRRKNEKEWRKMVVGVKANFSVDAWKDKFYIRTDDGAPKYRVFVAEPQKPERANWKEIIPEGEGVLRDISITGGHLALNYLRNAASELELRTLEGKPLRKIELPGIGSSGGLYGLEEDDEAYYAFTSYTVAPQIFRTSVKSGKTEKWAEVSVPVDPSPYTVEQVWFPSKDGTKISMFVIRRKDMPKDGSTPMGLYGYGGFNISMTPGFSGNIYPWLEAGGAYAIPNLRGGGEYGEDWHKSGMLEKKQNVFDDFIAAAEYLIDSGYTKRELLTIRGGSNGGLLVGAAMTQRPDLFRAVLCQVPLLDMVRYHKFGSGKTWIPEYGSADEESGFKTLYGYSPYHRVKSGVKYPAVIMMSADADDRVDPMHARKMTAALQAATTGEHPIVLRIEQHSGHSGADQVKKTVEQTADANAFLMNQVGLTPK